MNPLNVFEGITFLTLKKINKINNTGATTTNTTTKNISTRVSRLYEASSEPM